MLNFVVVSWFLTLGIVPQQSLSINNSRAYIDSDRVATVAEIGLKAVMWDKLVLQTSVENYQYKADSGELGFYPYRVDYKFDVGYMMNKNISFWINHECDHPVVYTTDGKSKFNYLSQETSLCVKFEGGF
jgi:hypothetical protein